MPSQRDNQKEAVRLLAIEIGVRPAARKLGLNEDTVCTWAKRGNWFATPGNPQLESTKALKARPGDVLLNELQEMETETRMSLAKASRRMAKDCEELPVRHADKAYTVAKTMAIVHRQDQGEGSKSFTLNVLNLGSLGVQVRQPDAPVDQVGSE